jgi:hypothetical protein
MINILTTQYKSLINNYNGNLEITLTPLACRAGQDLLLIVKPAFAKVISWVTLALLPTIRATTTRTEEVAASWQRI